MLLAQRIKKVSRTFILSDRLHDRTVFADALANWHTQTNYSDPDMQKLSNMAESRGVE